MDLDRLHQHYMNKFGYRSGRTYDMLVTVIQHADFGVSPILVKTWSRGDFSRLMNMTASIAHEMGYHTQVLTESRMMVSETEIVFSAGMEEPRGLNPAKAYEDHYIIEHANDQMQMQMQIRSLARGR